MKRIITTVFISLVLILSSCQSKEEKIKNEYIPKAEKYLNSYFKEMDEQNKFDKITIIKIDTITEVTEFDIAYQELKPLTDEFEMKMDYYKKLKEIEDSFGGEPNQQYLHAEKEFKSIYAQWNQAIDSITKYCDTIKPLMKKVHFNTTLHYKNGSKDKDTPMPVIFDMEGDISLKMNK